LFSYTVSKALKTKRCTVVNLAFKSEKHLSGEIILQKTAQPE